MDVLAIIPARGGSKGLPNKNILPLLDHPLIAYSIRAGQLSETITKVLVSTDSEKIRQVALKYGAEAPFLRPAEISTDKSTDIEFVKHALAWLYENEGYRPDAIVQLRPTSPVRFKDDIDHCVQLLMENDEADSLRVITKAPATPYKMWRLKTGSPFMEPLLLLEGVKEPFNQPRQYLPVIYWQVGTLDVIKTATVEDKNSLSGDYILPFEIDLAHAIDIDDAEAFKAAAKVITETNSIKV